MQSQTTPDEAKRKLQSSDDLVALLIPAAKVGVATGCLGLVGGGVAGFFTSPRPGPFAGAVGVQSLYYGASITFFRSSILAAISDRDTRSAKLFASGTAGAVSGLIASSWQRAPPARTTLIMGIVGLATQASYDMLYNHYSVKLEKPPFLERISNSRWMPLKSLPDREYEDILQNRIDKLEMEISSVESQLTALHQQKARLSSKSS